MRTSCVLSRMMTPMAMLVAKLVIMQLMPLQVASGVENPDTTSGANGFDAFFVFGDSLLDPGNRDLLQPTAIGLPFPLIDAHHLPYGRDFVTHEPTGRFCNGRIVSDFLASFMGFPFTPPYLKDKSNILQGCSFANSGSKIMNKISRYQFPRLNFIDQVRLFGDVQQQLQSRLGADGAAYLISRSLFLTALGSNDVMADYILNPVQRAKLTRQAFYQTLIATYAQMLQELYRLGARKFAVVTVPAVGCIPALRALLVDGGAGQRLGAPLPICADGANEIVNGFNAALGQMVNQLQADYPDSRFLLLDTFKITVDAVTYPMKYGFLYGFQPCCGYTENRVIPVCNNRSTAVCEMAAEHVFWDFAHPTEAFNLVLARTFWEGSSPNVYPMNLQELARI
ncbi:hypothetical protein KP509_02G061100 [Ceratopteris richardii]|uniref:GDSL esterase/lipase n=1 Tax=Ceratopteris richardii TaxID=49495 RepID=A0A8T2V6F2_CERRI|nr:hypothetical protein KP509_02G061100 [Ceratopteris richardii]